MTDYEKAKEQQNALEAEMNRLSKLLQAFPKGFNDITPDAVKYTPEYQTAKNAFDASFAALRKFNTVFFKRFKAEYAAERAAAREQSKKWVPSRPAGRN